MLNWPTEKEAGFWRCEDIFAISGKFAFDLAVIDLARVAKLCP
jgi:hypothetical protein